MKGILLLMMLLLSAGCAYNSVPEGDKGFVESPDLDAFVGCYHNCSDSPEGSPAVCLSSILWPGAFNPETRPSAVSIERGDGNSLIASAITAGVVLRHSRFVEGEDFEFRAGRIELKREYAASGAREPGNPFIGVASSQTVLGLDASGQGRISQSTAFAGTGFLIVPVAGKTTSAQKISRATADLCENQ